MPVRRLRTDLTSISSGLVSRCWGAKGADGTWRWYSARNFFFFSMGVFREDNVRIRRSHTAHFHRVAANAKFPTRRLHSESVADVFFFFPLPSVCLCGRSKGAIRLQERRKSLNATCSKPPDFFFFFLTARVKHREWTTRHPTSWRWSCSIVCKLKSVLQYLVVQRSYFSRS